MRSAFSFRAPPGALPALTVVLGVCALLPASLFLGCGSSGSIEATGPAPLGIHVSSTGCKDWDSPPLTGESNSEDCIVWEVPGDDLLLLKHVNTAFNCCPEFEASVDVEKGVILITEHETEGLCDCICLFDLGYEIDHLPPGVYRVVVSQEYLRAPDDPLEFTMDLLASPSGNYCAERTRYPWGS